MMKKLIILGLVLLLIPTAAGCSGSKKDKIVLACKPMTEQYILAEILTQLIEEKTELKVEQQLGLAGGTSSLHPGMLAGEIDLYPEYTGTGWLFVLKKELIADQKALYLGVKEAYAKEYSIEWSGLYGFNNTYRLAVTGEVARTYNLKTMSDLAKVSNKLTFVTNADFFEREDGYKGLVKVYGYNFGKIDEIDIGLRYEALRSKKADVIAVFSTDGQLADADLVIMEDDKNYFPYYDAATLIRQAVLKEHPELKAVLELLTGKIQDKDMIMMNYQVEIKKEDPKAVARDFLSSLGLLDE